MPRARARVVPSARQDGARAPRLLFDLEGLIKGFPVCIQFLGTHSASECSLNMFGVCQVLCQPVEAILNRNLALFLKDFTVG